MERRSPVAPDEPTTDDRSEGRFAAPMQPVHAGDEVREERDRLLREIGEQRERLHGVLDSMTEGVVIADGNGAVIEMNAEALRLHGLDGSWSSHEDPSHPPSMEVYSLTGEPVPPERSPLKRILAGERLHEQCFVVWNAETGQSAVYSYSGSSLSSGDGEVSGAVMTVRDVTAEHRAEDERVELLCQLEAISRISDIAMRTTDTSELLRDLLTEVVDVMDADAGTILLREGDELVAGVAIGLEEEDGPGFCAPVGEGFAGRVAAAGETRFVEDLLAEEDAGSPYLRACGIRSLLGAPLSTGEAVIGVVHVDWKAPRRFDAAQARLLELAADRCALALETGRLREAERRSLRLSQSLDTINRILLSTLSLDEMMEKLTIEVSAAAGADKAMLIEPDGEEWVVRHVHELPDELVGARYGASEAPGVEAAARGRRPILVEDARSDERVNRTFSRRYGFGSSLIVPMNLQGGVMGVVTLGFTQPRRFDESWRVFADRLAGALSLALENVRMYENEHKVAQTLQESLLALPAHIPGLDFAHAYHAAGSAARVGGDFYDVFELEHGLTGLVMGDVSGKGLEAAVLTALVKNTIRAHAVERGKTPSDVVGLANDVIFKETGFETFVTLFFGMLDRRDGRLVYCNAGHPTAAVVRGDGSLAKLAPNSPLAGAFREASFEVSETHMEERDLLFMYTDGLIEAFGEGERFREDRLFPLLVRAPRLDPADVVDLVLNEVLSFCGFRLNDDVALLAVRRAAEEAPRPVQQKLPF